MPRILMTYAEVAEHFGGDAATARQSAIALGITRYKGPDGQTYVELSPMMAQQYLQSKLAHTTTDQQVSALRHAASIMGERSGFAASQAA